MNAALNAYDKKDFAKAAISFEASIALLPEDYKPEINTAKYEDLVKSRLNIVCDACKIEHKRTEIYPYKVLQTNIERLLSGQQIVVVWKCPKCDYVRPLEGSMTKELRYQLPTYFGVIPEPPRREGLHDRIGFMNKFKIWYDIVSRELEAKIGLYRAEYAAQQDAVMEQMPDE